MFLIVILDMLFDLIKFNWTIKKESRKIKTEIKRKINLFLNKIILN